MKLAQAFLISAGQAVERLGVEAPEDRLTELTAAYTALTDHSFDCDNCNETESPSDRSRKAPDFGTMPDRDDIPGDAHEKEQEFIADREVGFHAGLEGQEPDDSQSKGWQRGWADAQE
ncbi:hypothetical protein HDF16_005930 [Granulicella aggregans]|uniref:Uncharacterized protein n=1 Tax=Granulicella aggregans TaxID=474949 RepID=A0A7W7ZJP8_9BACT|nr:hypothetical protein [Granulicella aggregans]MBB5061194.1 hypothetical protein [Granulicella aggregans]